MERGVVPVPTVSWAREIGSSELIAMLMYRRLRLAAVGDALGRDEQ